MIAVFRKASFVEVIDLEGAQRSELNDWFGMPPEHRIENCRLPYENC